MSIGTTRIAGRAGNFVDLQAYLAGDLGELKFPIIINPQDWTYGTGANQVNIIFQKKVTLADAANTTLDLYASGSLLDVFNRALTMSALKLLYIKNNSTDATLKVFGGASNDIGILAATNDILNIPPGGTFLFINPSAAGLVISTNKNLKLEHDGTGSSTMDVDVIAMGLD
jgi:hypothetical protein